MAPALPNSPQRPTPNAEPPKRLVVREMFARIAIGYDRLNSLLSFGQHEAYHRKP